MRLPEYVHEANVAGLAKALEATKKPVVKAIALNERSIKELAEHMLTLPDNEMLWFWESIPQPYADEVCALANELYVQRNN